MRIVEGADRSDQLRDDVRLAIKWDKYGIVRKVFVRAGWGMIVRDGRLRTNPYQSGAENAVGDEPQRQDGSEYETGHPRSQPAPQTQHTNQCKKRERLVRRDHTAGRQIRMIARERVGRAIDQIVAETLGQRREDHRALRKSDRHTMSEARTQPVEIGRRRIRCQ